MPKVANHNRRLRSSIALEQVKAPPDPYSVYKVPMNWEAITTKAHSRQYASCRQFEIDLFRMFEKARRAWPAGGSTYGWILICQVRLHSMLDTHGAHLLR